MTTLPAGAWPDGFVRVTTCPTRVWSPTTVNPSLLSAAWASAKVMPTTSGIGTTGGVLAADALTVGLAVGVRFGDAVRELAGDAVRELAGDAVRELAAGAGADAGVGATAELDRGVCAAAAGVFAAAAWLAGAGAAVVLCSARTEGFGEALSCHAVSDPASSRSARRQRG